MMMRFGRPGLLRRVWPQTRLQRWSSSHVTEDEAALAVKAYYMARGIDVQRLYDRSDSTTILRPRRYGRESVMLTHEDDDETRCGHVVVFTYGSVVFFNVDAEAQKECLDVVGPFCNEAIPEGFRPTEDYYVIARSQDLTDLPPVARARQPRVVRPASRATTSREPASPLTTSLGKKVLRRRRPETHRSPYSSLQHYDDDVEARELPRSFDDDDLVENNMAEIRFDAVVLPRLDVHNLSVIATVMAQTVALDHYSVKVDAMLETFTRLNSSIEKTGVFNSLEKNNLFKLVALNNTLFTDVIAKIGLLERSETAWKSQEYTQIWEGLREEFEVEDRFEKIEFKLNLVQLNTKFFLEVLANQKTNTLEWIIIVLISLEIIVCSCDLCNIRPFG